MEEEKNRCYLSDELYLNAKEEEDYQKKINFLKKSLRYNKKNVDSLIYLNYLKNSMPYEMSQNSLMILNELELNTIDYAKVAITYARQSIILGKNQKVIDVLCPLLNELNAKDYILWAFLAKQEYEKALNVYYEFFMDDNLLYLSGIMYLFFKLGRMNKASAYYDKIKLINPFYFSYLIRPLRSNINYIECYSNANSSSDIFANFTILTFLPIIQDDEEFFNFIKKLI